MDRLAAAAILVVLLGIWVHPFLTGARAINRNNPAAQVEKTKDPATTLPTTQPFQQRFPTVVGHPGFWRLAKSGNGVWWFVSPTDQPEFLNTVTTVQPYQLGRDKDGPHYLSLDYARESSPTRSTDGDLDKWAQNTMRRV